MRRPSTFVLLLCSLGCVDTLRAEEPYVSYIFPAGGQRGTTVKFHVGGHYLHGEAAFSMYGAGVKASDRVREAPTMWFEGPIVPLPASQQKEDYPKDHAGQVQIAADAPLGQRLWRVRTSQGVTPAMPFVIGDLPEMIEEEIDGQPIPVEVQLPITINGRIFPREDVDIWSFRAKQGQMIWCEALAARIGSGLEPRLEIVGPTGQRLTENSGYFGDDAFVRFTAPTDGVYQARINDVQFGGLQHYVYRLTISAGPHVELTYPAGGQRGTTAKLQLIGTNVPAEPVPVDLSQGDNSVGRIANPSYGEAISRRIQLAGQWTNSFSVEVGDAREELEQEPNNTAATARMVQLPATANGRIDSPGDVDFWSIQLAKDQEVRLDLRAARLGSPMDGVLAVLDAAGKELARSDDISGDNPDCQLTFRAPAAGKYGVRVAEQFATRGGPRFIYRLSMISAATTPAPGQKQSPAGPSKPSPDFRLTVARDTVTVMRPGSEKAASPATAQVNVTAERLGNFDGPIELKVTGLPAGVTFAPTTIAAKQPSATLTFKADATAKIGGAELTVEGVAELGEPKQRVTRTAAVVVVRPAQEGKAGRPALPFLGMPALDRVALAVGLPTPFKFKSTYQSGYAGQGTTLRRHYTLERGGYNGPLTVMLADRQGRHLQGVSGAKLVVPAGASEFEYAVQLPPWLEVGRTSRSNLMAVGEIVDADGSRHRVSYTTVNQSEQIVALADPGPLSITVLTPSIIGKEGGAVEVAVRIGRGANVALPVRVELAPPAHIKGVTAEPIEVPTTRTDGKLVLRFAPGCGPFNMPLLLRATAAKGDDRFVAEAGVEVAK